MQSVFNTSELLFHISKRLPDREDVCNLRAVCRSARTGILISEAMRFRDTSQPHLRLEVEYVVQTKRHQILAQLLVAENPEDFSATLPPMILILHQDIEERWYEYLQKTLTQPNHSVDCECIMSCKLYLERGCDYNTGIKFVNHFLRDQLDYSSGEFKLFPDLI